MAIHGPRKALELPESPHLSIHTIQQRQRSSMSNSFHPILPISLHQLCTPWQHQNHNLPSWLLSDGCIEFSPAAADPTKSTEDNSRVRTWQRSLSLDSPHTPSTWEAESLQQQYSETINVMTPAMENPCNLLRQLCTPWQDQNLQLVLEAAPTNIFLESSPAIHRQLRVPTALQLENSSPAVRFRSIQRSLTIGSPHTPSKWRESSLKQERFKIRGLDLGQESPMKLNRFKVRALDLGDGIQEAQGDK
uniref:Uncharacterized protein n=1 Tax=Nelumbo nucifera TaxID=4432 RepID=A0A822ZRT7_NELNU|nr:TPA_asm: hypothetical protein HUJ06_018581 [Nelumbo nucifera]